MNFPRVITLLILLLAGSRLMTVSGQAPNFFHLTTAGGLADNNIRSLAIDKKGFLWMGTIEGLSMFDGYRVTSYLKNKQPLLASNNIIHLTCDTADNIWIGTPDGISWLDNKRNFHRVTLEDSIIKFGCRTILDTKKYGPVLFTSLGQFYFDNTLQKWKGIKTIPAQLAYGRFVDAEKFDADKVIYATDSLIVLYDYATGKIVYESPCTGAVSVCRYNNQTIAIAFKTGQVQLTGLLTGSINRSFQLTREVDKTTIPVAINEIRMAANGSLLVSTTDDGFAVITTDGVITRYYHDPIVAGSLGSNNISRVLSSPDGDIIIGSRIAGISTYNIYNRAAGYTSIFNDGKGHFYDNFISKIAEAPDGSLWLGGYEQVIRWDRKNNRTTFFPYYPQTAGKSYEIRTLCVDKSGRLWAGSLGNGIAILNEQTGVFKHLPVDTMATNASKSKTIVTLYTGFDGTIWVSTVAGFYTINPKDYSVHSFNGDSILGVIAGQRVNVFMEDKKRRLWMATLNDGLYCYDKTTGTLKHFAKKDGLASDQVFGLCEDKNQNIYAGCSLGFSVIKDDRLVSTYNQDNGIRYDRCDGILEDNHGKIWISDVKSLLLFDPVKKTMQFFGQNAGISAEGFRVGSLLKTRDGELIWGSRKGINYFFPEQLVDNASKLKVSIYQVQLNDSIIHISSNAPVNLGYKNNTIIFRFTAIDLQGSANIQYRYMLDNYDKSWQEGIDIRESRYSLLAPGNYTFKLMASADGSNWTPAVNAVTIHIVPPVWQRWWFRLMAVILLAAMLSLIIRNRRRKIKRQKEELETEQAISYFMTSMSEQQTEEAIVWDVAKNCIDRLHFDHCVIYMKDENQDSMVQKVTHESTSRKAAPKRSSVSVQIMYNEQILGVIDCKHSQRNFFTQKHLSILTKIAALCANKIVRARAEKEKKEAERALTDTQRKMTEIEMHALRAQMNPHFIFNCLNSINRYIVKSDQTTASLYLTKFAKLIRLILDNSNSKNVLLTNELDALKLYIEMEALRFDKKFTYEIKVDGSLATDCVEVPPLIIQPYVENAIWHGLLHKETSGHLSIRLHADGGSQLHCTIEDNGIGRQKAKDLKSKTAVTRKSLGMELTENRLSLLNKHAEQHASVDIIDMMDGNGKASGTKVILTIPI